MPTRIQNLSMGLGKAKQADIATASASYLKFRKLNMEVGTPQHHTETDEDEVGKGHEFITQQFNVAKDYAARLDKYGSAEFCTWAMAYGLGNVSEVAGLYTLTPIDATSTLELPYFSVVDQVTEGGGSALDYLYYGCAIDSLNFAFNYGPGRQSTRMTCDYVGSGKYLTPSAVSLPAVQTESYMLSQSMALTINGVNYVSAKTILSGNFGWSNALNRNAGYFPGSGTQDNAAIRGRLEIGKRVPTFQFTARLLSSSSEYSKLIAGTTGTAVLTVTFDATHTMTITLQKMSFRAVENGETDGILSVTVTGAPQYDSVNGVVTVTSKCGVTGIAQ